MNQKVARIGEKTTTGFKWFHKFTFVKTENKYV